MAYLSAEVVQTESGKQYHIGLKPGDLAPYVLMCGDPKRAKKTAAYLKKKKGPIQNRDYTTITGEYEGVPVSVMATGMGPDNTEMAMVEMGQILKEGTFIRVGSCGALQKEMKIGDLAVSTGAVRLENTTSYFVHEGYPALAHHEVTLAIIQAASDLGFQFHTGITATAPGFYGAQGRRVSRFPPRDPELPAKLASMGVINFEMEASALFVLSSLAGFRAGAVCAVYADRDANQFIDAKTMDEAETRCVETGLNAVKILSQMDKAKGKQPRWLPKMGL